MKRFFVSLVVLCALESLSPALVAYAEAPYVVQWSRQIGTTSGDYSQGIAVDSSGNSYISGYTGGSLGGPNAGAYDAFLAKYDAAGNFVWSRQIGTTSDDYSNGVAVDVAGNAYITGYTAGSLDGPNAGFDDAFLTKYDGAGNLLWSRQIGTTDDDASYGVAVDATGNAYISGWTSGSLGGPTAGELDAFLTKYDGAGNLVWSRQIGTEDSEQSFGVAVDAVGNAYISGYTYGHLDGTNVGATDAFLTRYDALGNVVWSRQIGSTTSDWSNGVAVDLAGNAYISGWTIGSLDGTNAGGADAFLTKYDALGNVVWSRQIGTTAYEYGQGVAVDAAGNAYITGYTPASLGGPSAGGNDAFLFKYDSAGNLVWSHQIGTTSADYSYGVAVDVAGNPYITGYTSGSLGGPNAGPPPGSPPIITSSPDAFLVKFAVPEPSTFALATLGILGLATFVRRASRQ